MNLQKKLKADAEVELDELIDRVRCGVNVITDKASIEPADIMRLIFGTRTASVRKRCVAQIVNRMEEELYDLRQSDNVHI